MKTLIVLPTQLFDVKHIQNLQLKSIIIVEHPFYFTRLKFHKLKLAFHVASMLSYSDHLKTKGFSVRYIKFNEMDKLDKKEKYVMFDPVDRGVNFDFNVEIIETPLFLTDNYELKSISYKRLSAFYNNMKRMLYKKHKLNYMSLQNLDKLNRKRMPKDKLETFKEVFPIYKNRYYKKSIEYVNANFKNNFGDMDTLVHLPVTHKDAAKHFSIFLTTYFNDFGPYQDFVSKDHVKLYHSNISFLLNTGLLTSLDVLKKAEKYRKISPQSFEGFIRQVIGWREYMRYIYVKEPQMTKQNFWGNTKTLDWDAFYGKKSTGITFLDNEIQKLKKWGWAHHITRLMLFLNYFVLKGIKPDDINKWFQETISLDSYPWVMESNIWTMGYFTKKYTSRPYISSGNYIKKMSDYNNPQDFEKFDLLYKNFLKKNKNKKFFMY